MTHGVLNAILLKMLRPIITPNQILKSLSNADLVKLHSKTENPESRQRYSKEITRRENKKQKYGKK